MTIDEAIKHCEEVAEEKETDAKVFKTVKATEEHINKCLECAKEHRQLAEWLRELKRLREEQKDVYINGYNKGHEDGYCEALEDSH